MRKRTLLRLKRWIPEPLKHVLRRLRPLGEPTQPSSAVAVAPSPPRESLADDDALVQKFVSSGECEVVETRGGTRIVRRVWPRPWDVAQSNRDIAVKALAQAGSRYFDVGESGVLRSTLAVPAPDWESALEQLAAIDDHQVDEPVYVDLEGDFGTRTFLLGAMSLCGSTRSARQARVYRLQRGRPNDSVWGFEARSQLQRWDPLDQNHALGTERDGSVESVAVYAAPTVNGYVSRVAESEFVTRDVPEWGRTRRRLEPALPTVHAPQGPVDVVYLWVNGSDPEWYARMRAARGLEVDEHSHHPARFRDRGELRHSMRSMMLNVPWVNHIYLVTDRQVPRWLDAESSRITIVDHREIFSPAAKLPTFNSHAIGSRLHHIPGLSEKYLLMNDDVFFNRPAAPNLFFSGTGGVVVPLARTAVARVPSAMMSPIDSARENSARLIEQEFGRRPTQLFRHTPVPQLKSLMGELESRYPHVFAQLEKSQFRSHDDHVVNSWLHHYTALMTHRGTPGRYDYRYVNLASEGGWSVLNDLRPTSKTVTFCINDVGDADSGDDSHALEKWLSEYYPQPSGLELEDGLSGE